MSIVFFNTLKRKKEEFIPINKNTVKIYTCGPTVYNYAHIGNFRAYIFEDLLRRYLKFKNFKIIQVQNITDVDDKTIKAANEKNITLKEYTQKFINAFFEDINTLNIEKAEYYPAATQTIPEMICLIEILLKKDFAYQSEDGSIYFNINKFPQYGQLANLDRSSLKTGVRINNDEYEKANASDFALWKAWDEKDGNIHWPSPWGRGRPGWHIECSAMSMKYLGEYFDIHTGGIDNIFPHHEDEIAQSQAATGRIPANYWLHCAHLVVEGKKMSKSAGNFFTLRDLLSKGYTGRNIRYELISTHYRQTLNFSFVSLEASKAALERLDEFSNKIIKLALNTNTKINNDNNNILKSRLPDWALKAKEKFIQSLDDDLNISEALASIFDIVHNGNKAIIENKITFEGAKALYILWQELDNVLGFLTPLEEKTNKEIEELLNARQKARLDKKWPEADNIRKKLNTLGWSVKDTINGQEIKRIS